MNSARRWISVYNLASDDCQSGFGSDELPPRTRIFSSREPISVTKLQEELYYLERHEQSTMRNIDASVGDVKQELLDIQSAFNYYRTRLDSHARETNKAWELIERHKNGKSAAPVRPRPLPYRVFRSAKLNKNQSSSCENLSCTGSGIDRRWNISMTRLNMVGEPAVSSSNSRHPV